MKRNRQKLRSQDVVKAQTCIRVCVCGEIEEMESRNYIITT